MFPATRPPALGLRGQGRPAPRGGAGAAAEVRRQRGKEGRRRSRGDVSKWKELHHLNLFGGLEHFFFHSI